tara:strand:+ start:237 stop:950 length:714 start_codon:yes stop_codon:yes gene_type:complete
MLFNKTIDIHFYTNMGYAHDFAGIKTDMDTKPKWFKNIKSSTCTDSNIPKKTLKACPGIQEYHRKVIQMPLWSDMSLQIGPKGSDWYKWQFSDGQSFIRDHPSEVINHYRKEEDFQQLLIECPWTVKCDQDVDFLLCQPLWHSFQLPTVSVTQGVLNFKHQSILNVQTYITRTNETQDILVKHGTPIAELVPLTEKKVKVHTHLLDNVEYEKLRSSTPYTKFTGSYYHNRKLTNKRL